MSESPINPFSRRALLRYSAVGVAAVGGGSLLGACSTTNPETGQTEQEGGGGGGGLKARADSGQPIRLAIANEPPYTKLTADGKLTGAAPDVAKAVLKKMGYENIEPKQADYKTMISGLDADRWDMVTAGLFMNEARCADVLYSSPVIVSPESFALPAGNPKGIKTIDDIKSKDVKLGVLQGSFELNGAKAVGVSQDKLSAYPLAPKALKALAAGRVDAVLLPTLTLQAQKEDTGGNFDVTPPLEDFPKSGSGAAFRKSDKEFHAEYDKTLEEYKKTDEFAAILDKWGFSAKKAREATTEELCANPAG